MKKKQKNKNRHRRARGHTAAPLFSRSSGGREGGRGSAVAKRSGDIAVAHVQPCTVRCRTRRRRRVSLRSFVVGRAATNARTTYTFAECGASTKQHGPFRCVYCA